MIAAARPTYSYAAAISGAQKVNPAAVASCVKLLRAQRCADEGTQWLSI